ncbi:DUF2264 domain-containing protein [Pedobacter sp. Du54]|uniref:DUF2264 domain-containing protein n=1 Tax=Pedobacter anseongensis TaxID=3133439 RepID=UPI00309B1AFB
MKIVKISFLVLTFSIVLTNLTSAQKTIKPKLEKVATGAEDRAYWTNLLYKIASPVILNLANSTLKQKMPVEVPPGMKTDFFKKVTYLEAVGRTMAGVAPWLALPDDNSAEGKMRIDLRKALLKGISNAVDPTNPDYLNFRTESQPIVDAAYMAQAFLRAPKALWAPLDTLTKTRIIEEFKTLRTRTGAYNNWVLFAGINEAFLWSVGEKPDPARIEFARRKMTEWYKGDGWYSDGPSFSMDYYNAYVIHPMLVDFLKVLSDRKKVPLEEYNTALQRMIRYSEFSERIISPEGTYPAMGRSATYRTAAFQALGQVALMEKLPSHISEAQIRCGITAVMHRMFDFCNNFDTNGWLVLGFCGSQPMIADSYTSTGSLYMATLGFLPLGLAANHPFWTAAPADWTAKKAWNGIAFKKDYHVDY